MCVEEMYWRDDADVRRADAMTNLDHADGQMMIAGTEQMKNLAATDAHKSPRHISKLAGRTPVEQRSSDRKSEPDAETGPKHAQQVDDAPIINHARKPSESGGCRNGLSPAGGSDGRRAFENFRDVVLHMWRKRRLPSFMRRQALKMTDVYYPDTKEKYIVAWVPIAGQVYCVDLEYSYADDWLNLSISTLPRPCAEIKDWNILLVRPDKTVYKYEYCGDVHG